MHLAGNEFFNIIWIKTSNITKRENFCGDQVEQNYSSGKEFVLFTANKLNEP